MIQAIVYTSNTGYTQRYAQMLAQQTGLPLYDLEQASASLAAGAEIFYFGWLMAGRIQGYGKAARAFRVGCAIAVGMAPDGALIEAVRQRNALPPELPVFSLQGGYERSRVKGIYGFMMDMLVRKMTRDQKKTTPTEADRQMLQLMRDGGDWVRPEALAPVLDWFRAQ